MANEATRPEWLEEWLERNSRNWLGQSRDGEFAAYIRAIEAQLVTIQKTLSNEITQRLAADATITELREQLAERDVARGNGRRKGTRRPLEICGRR